MPWPRSAKSGYRIDIAELALEGGEMGEAMFSNSAKSPVIHFISGLDEEIVMPPKAIPSTPRPLASSGRGSIRARTPEDVGAKAVDRMDHWAFKKIVADLAAVYASDRAFVKVRLEAKGLSSIRARTSA